MADYPVSGSSPWGAPLKAYIDGADATALAAATAAQTASEAAQDAAEGAVSGLAGKANTSDVTAALAGKASTASVTAASDAAAVALAAANEADDTADAAQTTANNAIPKTADVQSIVKITQAAYDALVTAGTTVATRLYIIVG